MASGGIEADLSVERLKDEIHAALVGKAYIAVLKDRLANTDSRRSCREVFDEAYGRALRLAACEPRSGAGSAV